MLGKFKMMWNYCYVMFKFCYHVMLGVKIFDMEKLMENFLQKLLNKTGNLNPTFNWSKEKRHIIHPQFTFQTITKFSKH
jgi:hypothetical protein